MVLPEPVDAEITASRAVRSAVDWIGVSPIRGEDQPKALCGGFAGGISHVASAVELDAELYEEHQEGQQEEDQP